MDERRRATAGFTGRDSWSAMTPAPATEAAFQDTGPTIVAQIEPACAARPNDNPRRGRADSRRMDWPETGSFARNRSLGTDYWRRQPPDWQPSPGVRLTSSRDTSMERRLTSPLTGISDNGSADRLYPPVLDPRASIMGSFPFRCPAPTRGGPKLTGGKFEWARPGTKRSCSPTKYKNQI